MRQRAAVLVSLAVCIASAAASLRGQSPTPATSGDPAFDIVSVKPNTSGGFASGSNIEAGGRYTTNNTPLGWIVEAAWGVDEYQVVGGPAWMRASRFDIIAKANEELTFRGPAGQTGPTRTQLMLRNMLADRFKLKAHLETQEGSVYELTLARADGKFGPSFAQATADCTTVKGALGSGPNLPPGSSGRPCGMMLGQGRFSGGSYTTAQMVATLTQLVQRPVVDRAGLTGKFDWDIRYSEDQNNTELPSIYAALPEQLGLKLNAVRGPVEVLIVDHVEQPTPD